MVFDFESEVVVQVNTLVVDLTYFVSTVEQLLKSVKCRLPIIDSGKWIHRSI